MTSAPRRPTVLATRLEADRAELDLSIPADLFWFQGHFPGFPVLPGVVQIDWAIAYARECLGLDLAAPQRLQVKFAATIGPGDRLVLVLEQLRQHQRLRFTYRRDGRTCSSGQVAVVP